MVLQHLYVILMSVFLNKFVILRICGEMYVKVAHFLFFLSHGEMRFVLCSIWCLSLCIIAGGKPFCWAICRIVSHSLCCCVVSYTMIHKLRHQIEHKTKRISPQDRKNKKRVTFTYISPQIRKITNLFRNTDIRITYKCCNTIANWIKPPRDHTPPHNQCGIYQLTCNTCNLSYVGQTSRSLSIYVTSEATIPNQQTPYTFFETDTNTAPWIIL